MANLLVLFSLVGLLAQLPNPPGAVVITREAGGGEPAWCTGFEFCNDFEITDGDCTPDEIGPVGAGGRTARAIEDDTGELNCDYTTSPIEGSAMLRIDPISTTFTTTATQGTQDAVASAPTDHWIQFCHKQPSTSTSLQTFPLMVISNAAEDRLVFLQIAADSDPQVQICCNDGAERCSALTDFTTPGSVHSFSVYIDETDGANFRADWWFDGDPSVDSPTGSITCFSSNPDMVNVEFQWRGYATGPHNAVVDFDKLRWEAGGSAPGALSCS